MLALEEILVADDDGLQHMGIGQGRGVAHILIRVAGDFAQHAADDFAEVVLGMASTNWMYSGLASAPMSRRTVSRSFLRNSSLQGTSSRVST